MSGDPSFQIDVSFRNFKFTRGYAVKDSQDVLTELITNANDAYLLSDPDNLTEKTIYVTFHHVQNGSDYDNYLQVTDNAVGVEPSLMKNCFLVAGNKTSSDQARGFFSTGAKNITIMGDVHFTSIRNGELSKVYLDDQVYGHIVTYGPYNDTDPTAIPDVIGVPVSDVQRDITNIPNNGLNVILVYTNAAETKKFTSLNDINDMLTSLSKVATLRDIFSNPNMKIIKDIRSYAPYLDILHPDAYIKPIITIDSTLYDRATATDNYGGIYYERLTYVYPIGRLLLSTNFTVPNYPIYNANFVMFKTDTPIPQPAKENQMEFGFLIKDSKAIHEVNTLDPNERYRWNPNINYIYGYVFCDGFAEELDKYDKGETDELILDPNRVGGINHSHSLYVNILSFCLPRLEKALLDIQQDASFRTVNIQELDAIVNKLEELGVDVFNNNSVTFNYVPSDTGDLAVALQRTEYNVVSEVSGTLNVDIRGSDDAIINEIKNKEIQSGNTGNYVYYVSNTDELKSYAPPTIPPPGSFEANLHNVIDGINDLSVQRPFLYRLEQGEWTKTEIYLRGRIDRSPEYNDSTIKVTRKSLSIQFINDINHLERYLIDTTTGVTIKINLHNKLVADKLSKLKIDNTTDTVQFDMSENASYDALQFLETLMIDAFTDIVVESDTKKGRLLITDTNGAMKVLDYWTQVSIQIEPTIHALFKEFITKKKAQMQTKVESSVELAKLKIMDLFSNPSTTMEDVEIGATALAKAISATVSDII